MAPEGRNKRAVDGQTGQLFLLRSSVLTLTEKAWLWLWVLAIFPGMKRSRRVHGELVRPGANS